MESLLIKIFATALTLSQVTTAPGAIRSHFDRMTDQGAVTNLLRSGCAHMRAAFELEDVDVDDLISTAMEDSEAITGSIPAVRGINLADLVVAYRQFCKNESVTNSPVNIGDVIDFYNNAMLDLPDPSNLKGLKLPGPSIILDGENARVWELYEHDKRSLFIPLAAIPDHVQRAFIAAEDKRFYQHHGIDERALIRVFLSNLSQSGRPQGGSTITQQVVKNLLVGDDVTYERKMREMVLTARIETFLTKHEILELYLNSIYLGRSAFGVEMAARSYFGKSASALTLGEGALLAALTKGPNYFNPDRHPERLQERLTYVLSRMQDEGAITVEEAKSAATLVRIVAYEPSRPAFGPHFVDQVAREAKNIAGLAGLTDGSYKVHSTISQPLQAAVETALQNGLARYEMGLGRARFESAEGNLRNAIERIEADGAASNGKPAWQQALAGARLPLYDVHWPVGVVVRKSKGKGRGEDIWVGLADGRVVPLSVGKTGAQPFLKLYDIVFVRVPEHRGKSLHAELLVRPAVQGSAVVLENKTGRVLAMAGGFSYPLSQLNRVTQSQRQPGSALKPLTYLAALQSGFQPDQLVRDEAITLPPLSGGHAPDDYWSPKNYDGRQGGLITLRYALEHSKNLATVNLLKGGIDISPGASLARLCALAVEAQIYRECVNYYPFVLGAQPLRSLDLAAFYAAIANEGARPSPYVIDSIEEQDGTVYRHTPSLKVIKSVDNVSFFQLKTLMQGVLARGTAHAISDLAPYVAGKTGTTDDANDAWFVGFTNDVTVAVWVGYDNADGKRRTLGEGQTGASVAIPIFQPIIQAVWTHHSAKAPLGAPSPEVSSHLVIRTVSGRRGDKGKEYLRQDASESVDQRSEGRRHYSKSQPKRLEVQLPSRARLPKQQQWQSYGWQQQPQQQNWGRGIFGW